MKKGIGWSFFVLVIVFFHSTVCWGAEVEENEISEKASNYLQEEVIDQLDTENIDQIEEILGDVFIEDKISFTDLIYTALENDYDALNIMVYDYIVTQFFYELSYNKSTIIHIVILAIFAAIFSNFSSAFGNEQIATMGFYIIYLLLLIITLQSFQVIVQGVEGKIEQVLLFMSALCPIYFFMVAIASGTNSAIVFYNLSLLYIYVVELVILSIVLPLVNSYIIVQVLNYLSAETKLSKLGKLIKMLINWILKIMLAGVIGLNVIQGLIAPMIDQVQQTIWLKSAEAIPIVGDALSGSGEVVLGTLKLIKNGVGVVGLLLCIGLTIGPVIQMSLLTIMYKGIAAIIEPVSDKRISSCLYSVGEGCQILLKVVIGVSMLFLITIAVVTATTS